MTMKGDCLDYYIICQPCVMPSSWHASTTLGWSTHSHNIGLIHTHTHNTGLIHTHTQHWADQHTHTTLGSSTHTHNTGLIHTHTQHWADAQTISHWNTATCQRATHGCLFKKTKQLFGRRSISSETSTVNHSTLL